MTSNRRHSVDAAPIRNQDAPATDGGTSDLCFLPCGSRRDAPWYCVQTRPGAEVEAEWHLRNQLFAVYLPQFEAIRANRQARIGPLFPSYLFAQVTDDSPSWGPMRSTRGVATVLVRPGTAEPASVQAGILHALWKQCAPNGVIYRRDRAATVLPALHAGDSIRIVGGPFANMDGIVRLPGQNRIQVLLAALGQAVVTVDRKVVAVT